MERLLNGSRAFRLTRTSRSALSSRIRYRRRSSLDEQADLIRAYLDINESISRSAAAALLGVGETRASQVLSKLYNERGFIEPIGAARGRGVRYRVAGQGFARA